MLERIFDLFINGEKRHDDNSTLYYGKCSNSSIFYHTCKECGFENVEYNYYQVALYNDALQVTISYCEGDVYLEMFKDQESYEKGKEDFIKWYKENC